MGGPGSGRRIGNGNHGKNQYTALKEHQELKPNEPFVTYSKKLSRTEHKILEDEYKELGIDTSLIKDREIIIVPPGGTFERKKGGSRKRRKSLNRKKKAKFSDSDIDNVAFNEIKQHQLNNADFTTEAFTIEDLINTQKDIEKFEEIEKQKAYESTPKAMEDKLRRQKEWRRKYMREYRQGIVRNKSRYNDFADVDPTTIVLPEDRIARKRELLLLQDRERKLVERALNKDKHVNDTSKKRDLERKKSIPGGLICKCCSQKRLNSKQWVQCQFNRNISAVCRKCFDFLRINYFDRDAKRLREWLATVDYERIGDEFESKVKA